MEAYSCEGFEAVKVELDVMKDDMEKLQVRENLSAPAVAQLMFYLTFDC